MARALLVVLGTWLVAPGFADVLKTTKWKWGGGDEVLKTTKWKWGGGDEVLKTTKSKWGLLNSGGYELQFRNPLPALRGCEGLDCVERYVNFNDQGFSWNQMDDITAGHTNGRLWTQYRLNLTSQTWHIEETGRARWTHELFIIVPDHLNHETQTEADDNLPHNGWAVLGINVDLGAARALASLTGVIAVALTNVPNEGIDFSNDPRGVLDEEVQKAWSWTQFAKHPDQPEWVVELPSAKAAVRAMDAVAAFSRELGLWTVPQDHWIVTGASKRGMACYHTAAVDQRVKAMVPLVIALHRSSYASEMVHNMGGFSDGSIIYDEEGVNMWFDKDGVAERVDKVIDPFYWIDRLTMPKLLINVGNDAYFMPDITKHYWPQLPEPKTFYMFGDSPHTGDYLPPFREATSAFISGVVLGLEAPKISWSISPETGAISARQESHHTPTSVRAWRAWTSNARRRDFRRARWTRSLSNLVGRGRTWTLRPRPLWQSFGRWNALYIEFEYAPFCAVCAPYRLTTEVSVWPHRHPYPNVEIEPYNRHIK